MKNKKFNWAIIGLLLFATTVFAAKFSENFLIIGKGLVSEETKIISNQPGSNDPFLKYDPVTAKWQFANDGLLIKNLGSGSGSGGGGGINTLENASFEDGLGGFVNSGGTLSQEDYTNALENDGKFARFIAASSGQYVETVLTTVPDNLGFGCMADFNYNQGDDAFDYKVFNSLSEVLASGSLNDLTGWEKAPTLTLPCPNAGETYKLRVEATGAGTIDLDQMYLGSNKGFSPSSSTVKNTVLAIGNGGQVVGLGTPIPFTEVNDSAGAFDGTTYTVQKGDSIIEIKTAAYFTSAVTRALDIYRNGVVYKRIGGVENNTGHDGAFISSKGEFSEGDTLFISLATGSGTLSNIATFHYLTINEDFTTNGVDAFSPEQASFSKQTGELYKAAGTQLHSSGTMARIGIGPSAVISGPGFSELCSLTEQPVGGNCVTDAIIGFRYDIPVAGKIEVCADYTIDGNGAVGSHKLVMVSNADSSVIVQDKNVHQGHNSSNWDGVNMCEIFDVPVTGEYSFAVYSVTSGTMQFLIANTAGTGQSNSRTVKFTIAPVSHKVSNPVVLNQVVSPFDGGHETVGCTTNQSGVVLGSDCSVWLSSIANPNTEFVDYNLNAKFSGREIISCSCTAVQTPTYVGTSQSFCNLSFDALPIATTLRSAAVLSTNGAGSTASRSIQCTFRR